MTDPTLIPPVTNSVPLVRKRPDKDKPPSQKDRRTPPQKKKKDDGRPHIDEFA